MLDYISTGVEIKNLDLYSIFFPSFTDFFSNFVKNGDTRMRGQSESVSESLGKKNTFSLIINY